MSDDSSPGYGLNFEIHHEPIEDQLKTAEPELEEIHELRIDRGSRINDLIEGENLGVLWNLARTYQGAIDVICIDPPYNTGMDDLAYDDAELSAGAGGGHSKWLSFMVKRLKLAYRLLSDSGVMFINVDEHEMGPLLLLVWDLFGERNVDVLIWPKTDPRFDHNRVEKPFRDIKIVHEYILACFKDRDNTTVNPVHIPEESDNGWVDVPQVLATILKGLGTTSSAKDELEEIFGDRYRFQTPKPRRLLKELIRAASKRDSVILDFFAGSGTTGHAVMDLNKEDGGERRFLLVNNNENEICREITYERLRFAIENDGSDESLRYSVLKMRPK